MPSTDTDALAAAVWYANAPIRRNRENGVSTRTLVRHLSARAGRAGVADARDAKQPELCSIARTDGLVRTSYGWDRRPLSRECIEEREEAAYRQICLSSSDPFHFSWEKQTDANWGES